MTAKVMVSFPEEFLAEVDRIAREEHRSRSELLREAMRLYMEVRRGEGRPGDDPRVRSAVANQDALAHLAPGSGEDSTADVRRGREARGSLTETDRQVLRELQRRLAAIAPLLDLRAFGSRARGDAAPDSDLDVFIELEACTPELHQRISEIAWEVGFEMERVISTVVATRAELEHGAMGANPLVLNVEREGVRECGSVGAWEGEEE
jgi:predicted nucleotidyltransferase